MGLSQASRKQHRTKVVVRKLPPTLMEADFRAAVASVVAESFTWLHFVQGKTSTRKLVASRAYLNFNDVLGVLDFKTKFDGHAFVNERGTVFKCTVEFAPWQKVPPERVKRDPRENTMDKDPEYLAFVEQYEKGPEALAAALREDAKDAPPLVAVAKASNVTESLEQGTSAPSCRVRNEKPATLLHEKTGSGAHEKQDSLRGMRSRQRAGSGKGTVDDQSTKVPGQERDGTVPLILRPSRPARANSSGHLAASSTEVPEAAAQAERAGKAVRAGSEVYKPVRMNRLFQETLKAATGGNPMEKLQPPVKPEQGASGSGRERTKASDPAALLTRAPYTHQGKVGGGAGTKAAGHRPDAHASSPNARRARISSDAPPKQQPKQEQPG